MEIWIIFALISCFATGMFWFFQKIESESKTLNSEAFIIYAHLWMVIIPILWLLIWKVDIIFDWNMLLIALILNFLYVIIIKTRLLSLKFLSSSTYFINYRIFSSILLLVLGQVFFWELISTKEYIWIFLWFFIFYLLLEKKDSQETKSDFKKWYIFLTLGIVLLSIIWLSQKYLILWNFDVMSYMLYSWFFWIFSVFILSKNKDKALRSLYLKESKDKILVLSAWIIFPIWLYWNCSALLSWWDVAIVYKIISYSLFIPIILSIIIYKEKVTWKKLLAFILTVASIWLFV